MLPFSELVRYRLSAGGRDDFRVWDLAVDLRTPEGLITAGLVRPKAGDLKACTWDRVRVDRPANASGWKGPVFPRLQRIRWVDRYC